MTRFPQSIAKDLLKEARQWDKAIGKERPADTQKLLEETEIFEASRPPRRPVSLRLDPLDLSMAKRIARKKGIPHSQLMALWLHERIEEEKVHMS